jgi:hypothetical protein
MFLNYKTNPPTAHVGADENAEYFTLLQPSAIINGGESYVYEIPALVTLTYNLMELLSISYQAREDDPANPVPDYAHLTAEQQRLYYPFAFMLACLQGNAFRPGQLAALMDNESVGSDELITQYIPDAIRIITANSGTLDEVREMIRVANQVPPANPD